MKSMHDQELQSLYRQATRGLPGDADRRLTVDELLALSAGAALGARQADAVQGLAHSSDQALLLRLLSESQALADELAAEVKVLRRPRLADQLRQWWRSAGMPPVFASAGIALMAVIGFEMIGSSPLTLPQTAQNPVAPIAAPTESPLFNGAFEASDQMFAASLESSEQGDAVFGGDFDS